MGRENVKRIEIDSARVNLAQRLQQYAELAPDEARWALSAALSLLERRVGAIQSERGVLHPDTQEAREALAEVSRRLTEAWGDAG